MNQKTLSILAINSIFIHTNNFAGSIVNGTNDSVIYSFFPKVSPGYKIIQIPSNPIFIPLSTNTIREFYIKITDQNSNLLDLRGEGITIRFHIREK